MINIVLYEPEIPGNTGNIMRSCVGANAELHLIKPLGFSLKENYIKRSGVNYIDKCRYKLYETIDEFFEKNEGDFYFLTRYGNKTPDQFKYDRKKNIYFIFGKESTGIPKNILQKHLNKCIRLPMSDNVRSLNLSNSVAIMIYEYLRQNNYEGLFKYEVQKGEDFLVREV